MWPSRQFCSSSLCGQGRPTLQCCCPLSEPRVAEAASVQGRVWLSVSSNYWFCKLLLQRYVIYSKIIYTFLRNLCTLYLILVNFGFFVKRLQWKICSTLYYNREFYENNKKVSLLINKILYCYANFNYLCTVKGYKIENGLT